MNDMDNDFTMKNSLRRRFLQNLSLGVGGASIGMNVFPQPVAAFPFGKKNKTEVSFVTGNDRREMTYNTLLPFKKEIRENIADKKVVIKTNFVNEHNPLCATHPDAVRGILDFLKPLYNKKIIVAEGTADPVDTRLVFEEYGYGELVKEYNVELVELNEEKTSPLFILGPNCDPLKIQVINTFLDPDVYMFSVTRIKTHNAVVATMGLKNVIMGAPMKHYDKKKKRFDVNDKSKMHGRGPWWLNYNMHLLAQHIRPQFTVIDGLIGMEGNGPTDGTPVEHGVAFAGPDVVAVDRIGVELMGIDIADIGYLNYCAMKGIGIIDRDNIKILGSKDPADYVIKYKMHERIEEQMMWKKNLIIGNKP